MRNSPMFFVGRISRTPTGGFQLAWASAKGACNDDPKRLCGLDRAASGAQPTSSLRHCDNLSDYFLLQRRQFAVGVSESCSWAGNSAIFGALVYGALSCGLAPLETVFDA
jgi:hypothetical protein